MGVTGPTRGRHSISLRSAASSTGLTGRGPSISTRTSSTRATSGTRLSGGNYEFTVGEDTTVGATYMKWFADAEFRPERDGLNVFNVRVYTAPLPAVPICPSNSIRVGAKR